MKEKDIYIAFISLILLASYTTSVCITTAQDVVPSIPRESTFIWGQSTVGPTSSMNPLLAPEIISPLFYEPLAYFDSLTGTIKPCLAKSWEWINDYTLQIKLWPIATWSDGSKVSADDLVFSLETESNPDYGGLLSSYWSMIDSVVAVDSTTININLKSSITPRTRALDELWVYTGSIRPIIPKKVWEPLIQQYGSNISTQYTNMDPNTFLASGPYKLYYHGSDRDIFKKVDNYWGSALGWLFAPEYFEYLYTPGTIGVTNAYQSGTVDFTGNTIIFDWMKAHTDVAGCWNMMGSPMEMFPTAPQLNGLQPNYARYPILQQQWLRYALAYAINYSKIVATTLTGGGRTRSPNFLFSGEANYADYENLDIIQQYYEIEYTTGIATIAYDPDKAVQILTEHCDAGSSIQNGWFVNGTRIGNWGLLNVLGWDTPITVTVAQCWSDIGILAHDESVDYGLWSTDVNSMNYDWTWIIPITNFPNNLEKTYQYIFVEPFVDVWTGSPCHYNEFFNGSYPQLGNTYTQVKSLVAQLWGLEPGTSQYINIVRQIQSIVVPQLPFIPFFDKLMSFPWRLDYWVNYPTIDDPHEYTPTMIEGRGWLLVKDIYPRSVETTGFYLSSETVMAGQTVTAYVTLRNTGANSKPYLIEIENGDPAAYPNAPTPLIWKIVDVPAAGTMTTSLSVFINQTGLYTLTLDNWRYGTFEPGTPMSVKLTVTQPEVNILPMVNSTLQEVREIKSTVNSLNSAVSTLNSAVNTLSTTITNMNGVVSSLSMTLYVVIGVQAITLILVIVIITKVFKKTEE